MDIDPNLVIDRLGGTGKTAALFEISDASVSGWRKGGIPKPRMQYLKVACPEVLVPLGEHPLDPAPAASPHAPADQLPTDRVAA